MNNPEFQLGQYGLQHYAMSIRIEKRKDGIWGLFAARDFEEGETIFWIHGGDKQESDYKTIETDKGHWFHPYGIFVNHSCNPLAFVRKDQGTLNAKYYLLEGDEITFDYLETETELKANFNCGCGAENCVGQVGTDR